MNRKSWKDKYFAFYRKVNTKGKWDTPTEGLEVATINSDISTINELLKWMIDEEIIDAGNVIFPKQEPDLKNYRVEANPAFFPEPWENLRKHYSYGRRHLVLELNVNTVGTIVDLERAWRNTWFVNWILFNSISAVGRTKLKRSALGT